MDKKDLKQIFEVTKNVLSNKKIQTLIVILLLITIIAVGITIRLQNLPLLKDSATGEDIPLALDPFYFLRVAETINEYRGNLPEYDEMRYSVLNVPWVTEITPKATLFWYKIIKIFHKDVSIARAHNLNPVLFFALGILVFFFLILVLTKSKWIAIISSGLLTIIPPYLYRTLTGFADHESIGMFAFFLSMLGFSLAMVYLEKGKKNNLIKAFLFGALVGFLSIFSLVSWGGIAKFGLIIFAVSFLLIWIINSRKEKFKMKEHLLFYVSWLVFCVLFAMVFGNSAIGFIKGSFLGYLGVVVPFVLLFILIDSILIKYRKKISKIEFLKKYQILSSFIVTIILSIILYQIFIGNLFHLISSLWGSIFHPFGTGRVGLTIAENKQPYLDEWWGQIGKIIFWMFYVGSALLGIRLSRYFKQNKNKIIFSISWIILISGILFSRISSSSLLNGENFISQFVYIVSVLIFLIACIWIYLKEKDLKIDRNLIIVAVWLVLMLAAARGAIRLFFAIVPFACFMASYTIVKIFNFAKKSKDDFTKIILFLIFILAIIGLIFSTVGFVKSITYQAKYTGPSADQQWQSAMDWVNKNTKENGLFMHWWDYGYWVQYLGKRPTVTDGGHYNGYWDHLIGRYVLTTPYPETAKSFAKAHNVSYLLIDQTDIGKYSAYSSIGSDESGEDRFSWIPTLLSNVDEIQETRNGSIRLYRGGTVIDQDIIYAQDGENIFLPKGKAFIAGITLERVGDSIAQPEGIFVYNNQQYRIPLKNVYLDKQLIKFQNGLESTMYVLPSYNQGSSGGQLDQFGAAMYLSQKVQDSLFAQLFLMNDPNNLYPEFKLIHSEDHPYVKVLKANKANIGEFIYFNGIQGPIKIWEITQSDNIIARQEFLNTSGNYAELDNLQFKI